MNVRRFVPTPFWDVNQNVPTWFIVQEEDGDRGQLVWKYYRRIILEEIHAFLLSSKWATAPLSDIDRTRRLYLIHTEKKE